MAEGPRHASAPGPPPPTPSASPPSSAPPAEPGRWLDLTGQPTLWVFYFFFFSTTIPKNVNKPRPGHLGHTFNENCPTGRGRGGGPGSPAQGGHAASPPTVQASRTQRGTVEPFLPGRRRDPRASANALPLPAGPGPAPPSLAPPPSGPHPGGRLPGWCALAAGAGPRRGGADSRFDPASASPRPSRFPSL